MVTFLETFPFPFQTPAGQELWRTLAGLVPVPLDATALAEKFDVDPLDLPVNLTPRQLWYVILQKTAARGTTTDLVKDLLAQNPRNRKAPFLKALIDNERVVVSPEPVSGFDPAVTAPEALLFTDDLTMAVGRIPNLITTLQRLLKLAPAVCLLRVENAFGGFTGTGFRIGSDLVLTNHHVLFPENTKAETVQVDFGFDVGVDGTSLSVISLAGDTKTMLGDQTDDWAVLRVADMKPDISVIDIAYAAVPKEGERAFIVQHPDGQQKRLGFVRNMITAVTDQSVQYLTDTQPGSSGAPVFNAEGRLIALHHRGGTPTQHTGKAPLTKNQGVRISRVVAGLSAQNVKI
ncbi:trypsin-like peptidase domain-containing protein [Mesorhizobium sp. Cs1299R1N1]|uniref:trypsin-like peptidase domain-containing protein n=1 Tax=Mesorhizobium sp. Cs1299R1N1 TaxID=3015172 RepID=UPI00301CE6E3